MPADAAGARPRGARGPVRPAIVLVGGVAAVILLALLNVTQGAADIDPLAAIGAIFSSDGSAADVFVRELRLPRAAAGLLAGAALGIAGVLMQTVTRNPLAGPDILGVTAGAYLAVVVATVWPAATLGLPVLLLAFAGGLLADLLVTGLAGGRRATALRLLLAGVVVSLGLAAFVTALQLLYPIETTGLYFWGQGTIVQDGWENVRGAAPVVALGAVAALLGARALDVLATGDATAAALGQRVGQTRTAMVGVAVALTAASVVVAGPLGFVGLVAPHVVRLVGIRGHRALIPASALFGGAIVLAADSVARLLGSNYNEIPVGIVTAIAGAPFLVWLARRLPGGALADGAASESVAPAGRGRRAIALAGALVALAVAAVAAAVFGATALSELTWDVVAEFRLPRIVIGALAGMLLAGSGFVLQRVLRNPIADPSVVGVVPGAALGAMTALLLAPGWLGGSIAFAALAGGAAGFGLAYAVSWRGGVDPLRLALVGVGVGIACSSLISLLILRNAAFLSQALSWLSGTLYLAGWDDLWVLLPALALLPVVWLAGPQLDLVLLGERVPRVLGMRLERARLALLGIAVALAAAAVAVVGALAFVGLLAPHAARLLAAGRSRVVLPLALVLGAFVVVAADVVGRVVLAPKEIPVGVTTAVIGAPYFCFLLWRAGRPSRT